MATHTYGQIEEFNRATDDWTTYAERLAQYFLANGVESADKKSAILLTVCGPDTYRTIHSLTAPAAPSEKTYVDILALVKNHFAPPPSEIMQRFNFHTRSQQGESVAEFVAELRRLSEFCNFQDTLESMLRDRLVCRINNPKIQRELLAEPNLLFPKAFELAQTAELEQSWLNATLRICKGPQCCQTN